MFALDLHALENIKSSVVFDNTPSLLSPNNRNYVVCTGSTCTNTCSYTCRTAGRGVIRK